jgi:Uncharacterized conserved protein
MDISFTPEALQHLNDQREGRVLRIAFTTGCGGSGYRLSYESAPFRGDTVVQQDGISVALDDMAAHKLDGAVIRYSDEEGGYLLDHPEAVLATWCG